MMEKEEQAWLDGLRKWCSSQERCTQDVRERLQRKGADAATVDAIQAQLEDEGFLNESRFAEAFVRARALYKGWGPAKIRAGLKAKRVPDAAIEAGFAALEGRAFDTSLAELVQRRSNELPEGRDRLIRWLLSRGFSLGSILTELEVLERGG